jgi:ribosomal RNA-processing protein 9
MSRARRKNADSRGSSAGSTKKQKMIDLGWNNDDEHIDSEESEHEDFLEPSLDDEDSEEEETLDAKKVRLAREYLKKLEAGDSDDSSKSSEDDESETEHDRMGVRLQRERLKREGTLEKVSADKVDKSLSQFRESLESVDNEAKAWIEAGRVKLLRGHDLTPTCVTLQSDGAMAISGSKDHSVLLWDVEQEKRSLTLCQSWKKDKGSDVSRAGGEVLSVACSDDGHYAAVGRRDATVSVFDIRAGKNNLVKTFTGHKGPVTCLGFRTQSLQMFSGSDDRCIRYVFSIR